MSKRFYASASVLLKAGSYQLKLDGAGLLPDIESLFNLDDAAKITESHVRGLLQKTRMKSLKPEDCWKILNQEDKDGKTMRRRGSVNADGIFVPDAPLPARRLHSGRSGG